MFQGVKNSFCLCIVICVVSACEPNHGVTSELADEAQTVVGGDKVSAQSSLDDQEIPSGGLHSTLPTSSPKNNGNALLPLAIRLDASEKETSSTKETSFIQADLGLWDMYESKRSAAKLKILVEAAASPVFAKCTNDRRNCQLRECRSFVEALGSGFHNFGYEKMLEPLRESANGPIHARSCALALAYASFPDANQAGMLTVKELSTDAQNALFLFDVAMDLNAGNEEFMRIAIEYSLYSARGALAAAQAQSLLKKYSAIVGADSAEFAEVQDMYDFVQFFWSKWDVTDRLGVNMGDPVTLSPDFDRYAKFRSGGRTFTVDDVIDRYYEMNRPGWREGRSYAEAYWGNGFYAIPFFTDDEGTILIRVDKRSYELTVDFLKEGEISAMTKNVRDILDYAHHGNAHVYKWDSDGLRKYISEAGKPFHQWYDMTLSSKEFYSLPLRDRINHKRGRQGMQPLPSNWRLR